MKTAAGYDPEAKYVVPEEVAAHYAQFHGTAHYDAWKATFEAYKAANPEKGAELERRMAGELPEGWMNALPRNTPEEEKYPKKATRQQSEIVLNAMAEICPEIWGGSADLTPSNLTSLKCQPRPGDSFFWKCSKVRPLRCPCVTQNFAFVIFKVVHFS